LGQTIRIDDLVDGQKIRGFNLNLLFWSVLVLFVDAYDITVMPFAMPTMSKLWHAGIRRGLDTTHFRLAGAFPCGRRGELLATARRMRRDLTLGEDTQFESAVRSRPGGGLGLKQIFGSGLSWITPLLWVCFSTTLMTNYFLNSWMPTLFMIREAKRSP
jgi:hypothetical protein